MPLQIGIRQLFPPKILFTLSGGKRSIMSSFYKQTKKYKNYFIVGLFALLRSRHQRTGDGNLTTAAKKVSNDLMPFSFKNSGNDLMSFCSKE